MNALVPIEPAPTAGPHGEGHTVLSPARQAEFLASLQLFGNVGLADHGACGWLTPPTAPSRLPMATSPASGSC